MHFSMLICLSILSRSCSHVSSSSECPGCIVVSRCRPGLLAKNCELSFLGFWQLLAGGGLRVEDGLSEAAELKRLRFEQDLLKAEASPTDNPGRLLFNQSFNWVSVTSWPGVPTVYAVAPSID